MNDEIINLAIKLIETQQNDFIVKTHLLNNMVDACLRIEKSENKNDYIEITIPRQSYEIIKKSIKIKDDNIEQQKIKRFLNEIRSTLK